MPATSAAQRPGADDREQIARNGPGQRLDDDVGDAEQQPGGNPSSGPLERPAEPALPERSSSGPIPTAPASKEIIAAVE